MVRYLWLLICVYQSHAQIVDFKDIDFQKADSIALSCNNENLENLPHLTNKLTSELRTDVERFRAIYKWVCLNIANDYSLYIRNKKKREQFKDDSVRLDAWNDKFKKVVFKKLRKRKKTICTGYAYILQKLSELAGLDCRIVHGFGRTSTILVTPFDAPNHSWNAIKLNNKWYLCDPTWASGIPNPGSNTFSFQYNDGYFLADPKLFAINHFPLDTRWLLTDKVSSFDFFLKRPILYGNAYNYLATHESPKYMHHELKKNDTLKFEFNLKKNISSEDIHFLIDNGYQSLRKQPSRIDIENQLLSIHQQFNTRGFFDVHLYLKDELISTYTVSVK